MDSQLPHNQFLFLAHFFCLRNKYFTLISLSLAYINHLMLLFLLSDYPCVNLSAPHCSYCHRDRRGTTRQLFSSTSCFPHRVGRISQTGSLVSIISYWVVCTNYKYTRRSEKRLKHLLSASWNNVKTSDLGLKNSVIKTVRKERRDWGLCFGRRWPRCSYM